MDNHYFDVLIARFWGAFGSAAGMPFADGCVQVAKDKGYYETVRANAEKFKEHPEEFDAALRCCLRTGYLAAEMAVHADRNEVSAKDFDIASDEIEGRIARVRARAAANGPSVFAGVCGSVA